jgi:type 1 glutamine amidotransferase
MASRLSRRSAMELLGGSSLLAQGVVREPPARKLNVMLLSGGTEYDSERSMTSLAQELESKQNVRCKLLAASDPNDLPVVDVIEDAHVVVMDIRGLTLPRDQMSAIRSYVAANKPLVALRGSLQAFTNWPEFGEQVLGARFQSDSGGDSGTDVSVVPQAASHAIVKGLPQEFHCRSSLYQVAPLKGAITPLLMGKSTGEGQSADRVPNPVAWIRSQKNGRIFYTTIAHPDDFKIVAYRLLLVNGINWALGR